MSAERDRDLALAIHHALISPDSVDDALNRWRHRATDDAERDRMWFVLAIASERALEAVLARRQSEAARDPSPWEPPRVDAQYGRMQDALERIVSWSEAYPLDIFPEPDLGLARELLEAGGITLDAVSAHCMRHVIDGVGKIAREATQPGPWEGGHHFQEEEGYPGSLLPPKRHTP